VIERLHPGPPERLGVDELARAYGPGNDAPSVRFNFVVSADGAATLGGRAGGLGNADDQRILLLLRRLSDVLLLGAGTVRAEGYGGELIDAAGLAWRREHRATDRPALAVLSGSLDLDPASAFFTQAQVRPVVFTTDRAAAVAPARLAAVAEIVAAGEDLVDPDRVVRELWARGHRRILCEGGPHLFGSFQDAGRVDELCLTVSPLLVGGPNLRVAMSAAEHRAPLALAHVLRSEGTLFLRYLAEGPSIEKAGTS
jgi:riboflavin biosynthesis pyrimidine reductase